ncbi:bifunctional molybdenum cofactor biosynthesis [Corynascus novoguineensis]|uniref:Bifunctional molybdenum cofactor biosynthesis n=1 Tax=Corynascus novoguineensis TaxID=1126955 RepID=A0AAN7HIW3_9PEZI|nr:bifunctional molybdenum cofactor biosynthesis [Corynascus novoguineensis]
MSFTPLILAGGRSSRMGSPKHLLSTPDGRPLYQHQIDLLPQVCPYAPTIYISLAQDSQLDDYLRTLPSVTDASPDPDPVLCKTPHIRKVTPPAITIIHDLDANTSSVTSAGPAAGLLAAHRADPARTWLVIACDYPLLTQRALERLCAKYRPPVTCFRNADGFCEPLLGVWGPDGLAELERRVKGSSASAGGRGGEESGRLR